MSSHKHQKDRVQYCPGSGFLISPTKSNSTIGRDASQAQAQGAQTVDHRLFKVTQFGAAENEQSVNRVGSRLTDGEVTEVAGCAGTCGVPGSPTNDGAFNTYHSYRGIIPQMHSSVSDSNKDYSGFHANRNRHYHTGKQRERSQSREGYVPYDGKVSVSSKGEHRRYSPCRVNERDRCSSPRCSASDYKHCSSSASSSCYRDSCRGKKNWCGCSRNVDNDLNKDSKRKDSDEDMCWHHHQSSHSHHRSRSKSRRHRKRRSSHCCQKSVSPPHGHRSSGSRRESTRRKREHVLAGRKFNVNSSRESSFPCGPRELHPAYGTAKLPLFKCPSTVRSSSSSRSLRPSNSSCHHSVSKLLLQGYQRGGVNADTLYRTSVLSTASSLQRTDSCQVFPFPESCENLDHMTHMAVNKDHDQLLCMWSVSGTALQQVQLVNVEHRAKTRCGELPLQFSVSESVIQTWGKISSLCWVDCPWFSNKHMILYTTNMRSCLSLSIAYIRCMDLSSFAGGMQHVDFLLGDKSVWSCAWNGCKQQFSSGLQRGCQVIDVTTRQFWSFSTSQGNVFAQVFSKTDGGNLLYSGVHDGYVLMHDMRVDCRRPIKLMTHGRMRSVCDLKLSADERQIFTSDKMGQIKRWDLRKCQTMVEYEGLCNQYYRLPFHIDDTQSIVYAAGTDCYTKIWCLESGRLLHSIPPPYRASPLAVPVVQFSSKWAGLPGNMGLLMGANKDLHLYSAEL